MLVQIKNNSFFRCLGLMPPCILDLKNQPSRSVYPQVTFTSLLLHTELASFLPFSLTEDLSVLG